MSCNVEHLLMIWLCVIVVVVVVVECFKWSLHSKTVALYEPTNTATGEGAPGAVTTALICQKGVRLGPLNDLSPLSRSLLSLGGRTMDSKSSVHRLRLFFGRVNTDTASGTVSRVPGAHRIQFTTITDSECRCLYWVRCCKLSVPGYILCMMK